jgi:hypothetical protein
MRNFEQPLAQLKCALATFKAVFFVATWKKRGSKALGVWHFDQLLRIMPLHIVRLFPYALMQPEPFCGIPTLRHLLIERNIRSEDISDDMISSIIPGAQIKIDLDNLLDDKFTGHDFHEPNAYRMLYKLKQCYNMINDFEKENETSFDYFLRIRPDMSVPENLLETIGTLNERIIVADNANEAERTTGDSLAWGYRSDLGAYLTLADRLEENLCNQAYLSSWRNIHYELFDAIASEGRSLRSAHPSGHILEERISREDLLNCIETSMDHVDSTGKEELDCFKNLLFGTEALESHNYLSARSHAKAAIELRADSATAHHLLAQSQIGLGNVADAFNAAALSLGFASNFWGDDYLSDFFSSLTFKFPQQETFTKAIENALCLAKNSDRLNAQLTRTSQIGFGA